MLDRSEDSEAGLGQSSDVLELREDGDLDDLEMKEARLVSQDKGDLNSQLLKDIAAELSVSEEPVGEKVRDELAEIVNGRFTSKLNPELQKKKFEKYNRPENCDKLVVPTVNNEIWSKLPSEAIKSDLKLQHIQRALIKATTACVRAADGLLAASQSEASSEAVIHMTSAVTILGHASRELSLRRRSGIRPHVNKQFSRICDEATPITDKLFGDSLSSTLKDVRETDRISANVSSSERRNFRGTSRYQGFRSHQGSGSPYFHNDSGRARGHFLGRGIKNKRQQWSQQRRGYQNPSSQ